MAVGATAEYLRHTWPELRDARIEIAEMPAGADDGRVPRWLVSQADKRIVLFRLPIERMGHLHRNDELHRRMMIEGCVFRAVAEYLDRDPWDLGPERFRFF